jgi:hypothetical protein
MTTNNTSAQAIEKCKELIQAAKSAPPERRLEALGIESTASYILSILEPTSAQQEGREDEKAIRAILRKHVDIGWMEAIESGLSHAVVCAMQEYATSQLSDKDKRIAELQRDIVLERESRNEYPDEFKYEMKNHHQSIFSYHAAFVKWARIKIEELQSQLQGERAAAEKAISRMAKTIACSEDGRPMYWLEDWKEAKSTYINNNYPSQEK